MKNCGVHKGSPARGAGSAQPRLRGCRRFVSAVCLRRPYLFSRKRKDRGEKSAWGRGVHAASDFRQVPMFSSAVPLGGHSTSFCYAPPDTEVSDLRLVALERLPSIEGAVKIQIICTSLRGAKIQGSPERGAVSEADGEVATNLLRPHPSRLRRAAFPS